MQGAKFRKSNRVVPDLPPTIIKEEEDDY